MSEQYLKSKIVSWLKDLPPQQWFNSGDVIRQFPSENKSHIYLVISQLATKDKFLDRRPRTRNPGYEYLVNTNVTPPQHVGWTEDEKVAIAREAARIRAEFPHMSVSDMLAHAQRVIPADRRKMYYRSMTELPWLGSYMEAAHQEAARTDKLEIETEKPKEVEKQLEPVEASTNSVSVNVAELPFDLIFGEVIKRLTVPLKAAIIDIVTSPEIQKALTLKTEVVITHKHHHHHHVDPTPIQDELKPIIEASITPVEKIPKKKIGIVSNQTIMEGELSKRFPHLKFVVTDKKYHEAADAIKNCDKVIAMTKFISHSTFNNVKSASGDRFVSIHGGLSEVSRQINLWINSGDLPKE